MVDVLCRRTKLRLSKQKDDTTRDNVPRTAGRDTASAHTHTDVAADGSAGASAVIADQPFIPNFEKCIQHFCIHAGGRGVLDALQKVRPHSFPLTSVGRYTRSPHSAVCRLCVRALLPLRDWD